VVENILQARSAFPEFSLSRYHQLTIAVREHITMVSLAAWDGQSEKVQSVIQSIYGHSLPQRPVRVGGMEVSFLWFGPDRWMAVGERDGGRDLEENLKRHLHGLAAVVDHSDGRAVLRLSGARARDVLAKGLPLDLHPRVFKANDVAITHASHIGVLLWQVDDAPTYDIAVPRSYAHSFSDWLLDAAEEFSAI
jgi:heterotetrameric sarcosine oxidase gamma subunit